MIEHFLFLLLKRQTSVRYGKTDNGTLFPMPRTRFTLVVSAEGREVRESHTVRVGSGSGCGWGAATSLALIRAAPRRSSGSKKARLAI